MPNSNDHSTLRAGLTRRGFIATSAAAGASLALAGHTTYAAAATDTLRVGFISPRTGALAGFGEGDGFVLDEARKALAKGLAIGGKTYEVTLIDQDTQSDPARAGQLAKDLINNQSIDMMLTTSTPEVVNPVSDACEAAGVPCLGTVLPWEAFYFGRGGKPGAAIAVQVELSVSFGTNEFAKTYLSMWSHSGIETNKKVGVLYPNDADGNAMRANLAPLLEKGGFTIVDPGPYEDGTTDYSAQIADVQGRAVRDLQHLPDPAGLCRLLAPGRPAGLHQEWSRSPRSPRPACSPPMSRRSAISASTSRAPPIGRRPSPTPRR